MPSTVTILLIALAALLLLLIVLITGLLRRSTDSRDRDAVAMLQQQLTASTGQQDQRLARLDEQLAKSFQTLTNTLNERLHQSQSLNQQTQQSIAQRLADSGKTIGQLKGQLGQLGQATQQIVQVGSEVRKLQDILQSPKLRGSLGEWSLENLLAEVLPKQHYKLQHRFSTGHIVDALVILAQGNVSIDSKFPLSNFTAMLETQDETQKAKLRKQFLRDVCKHIDVIAEKYILPEENTLDFALMYIPAENVYYETLLINSDTDIDISAIGRDKKVIPVSPNTLYAYLMVIATGLKGMQIEKNAQIIRQQLSQLINQLTLFTNDFTMIGKHISNAKAKHDDATKKIDIFQTKLGQIESDASPPT